MMTTSGSLRHLTLAAPGAPMDTLTMEETASGDDLRLDLLPRRGHLMTASPPLCRQPDAHRLMVASAP